MIEVKKAEPNSGWSEHCTYCSYPRLSHCGWLCVWVTMGLINHNNNKMHSLCLAHCISATLPEYRALSGHSRRLQLLLSRHGLSSSLSPITKPFTLLFFLIFVTIFAILAIFPDEKIGRQPGKNNRRSATELRLLGIFILLEFWIYPQWSSELAGWNVKSYYFHFPWICWWHHRWIKHKL